MTDGGRLLTAAGVVVGDALSHSLSACLVCIDDTSGSLRRSKVFVGLEGAHERAQRALRAHGRVLVLAGIYKSLSPSSSPFFY